MTSMTELLPENETEIEEIVLSAASSSQRMEIIGGHSKAGLGHDVNVNVALSMRKFSGITAYNPAEMVMSAKAGTPLAEIEAALAKNRQMLAFEPANLAHLLGNEDKATIGGTFAVNMSGPRRFVAGAARDGLLGVRFINGGGDTISSGGRVMKNVTGLDIVKLMAGSHGTLGLMLDLTFKVLPKPERSATLLVSGPDEVASVELMAKVMATTFEVSGAACLPESCRKKFAFVPDGEGAVTVLRLEGPAFSVAERLDRLGQFVAKDGRVTRLEDAESTTLWRQIRDVAPFAVNRDKPLWRVSVAPNAGAKLLNDLRMQAGVDGYLDWQGGLAWLQMEDFAEPVALRHLIRNHGGGHATLVRASAADRAHIPVFEPLSPAVEALNRRVREKFDPRGIFNPGRMGSY